MTNKKQTEKEENKFPIEDLEEYFLGLNPRKHKDFKFYGGKNKVK